MNKVVRISGIIFIMCIIILETFYVKASSTVSNLAATGDRNDAKVMIGILVLCLLTALVTLKRAISAKKNN